MMQFRHPPTRQVSQLPHKNRNFQSQFQYINQQNQNLIRLADSISKSSFMQPHHPTNIAHLEKQLRRNLSIFIDSIREFFVEMDLRIRALGGALEEKIHIERIDTSRDRLKTISEETMHGEGARKQIPKQNMAYNVNQSNQDPYQRFADRIQTLENNLKKTQENEEKLLEMVDKLSKTTHLSSPNIRLEPFTEYQQRPKVSPSEYSHNGNNKSAQSTHEASFRLFSLKNRPQELQPSPISRMVTLQQSRHPSTSYSPFVCNDLLSDNRRAPQLKIRPDKAYQRTYFNQEHETNNNNHRVAFLLKTLNS